MTLKELNQAFWLQQEIAGLSRQLEEMRERASTIPSAGFDNMPHGSGPKISRTEKQAVEIVELESRLNEQKAAKADGAGPDHGIHRFSGRCKTAVLLPSALSQRPVVERNQLRNELPLYR